MSENNPKTPASTVINEPKQDVFTKYKKDPRLESSILKKTAKTTTSVKNKVVSNLLSIKNYEDFLIELRRYKKNEYKKIIDTLEQAPFKNRKQILTLLSEVAETIIFATYKKTEIALEQKYGPPTFLSSYKQTQKAHLAIVAMGKLGSQKLNYYSDLDVIFIYSNRGETQGKKTLDNSEYFVKFAQKFINTLSLMTSMGRCYEIDTDLRPSGNTGMLVTSYDHFIDHQMNRSQNWERQALLRARAITDDVEYKNLLNSQIENLLYNRNLPQNFKQEMADIRKRVVKERSRESKNKVDIKLGDGGLMDIEFILHHIQLKYAKIHKNLRQKSMFDLLDALKEYQIFSKNDLDLLTESHLYYRTLESLLHLSKGRSENILDFDSKVFNEISDVLGFKTLTELKETILNMRQGVKAVFNQVYF